MTQVVEGELVPLSGSTMAGREAEAAALVSYLADRDGADPLYRAVAGFLLEYLNLGTRKVYSRDLAAYLRHCHTYGLDPLHVDGPDLGGWVATLQASATLKPGRLAPDEDHRKKTKKTASAASVRRQVMVISAFYRYLVEEGFLVRSPLRRKLRKGVWIDPDHTDTTSLDRDEAIRFRAGVHAEAPAVAVSLLLMLLLGLRVSEVLGATWRQIRRRRGHRTITVTRKGGKTQTLPIPEEIGLLLDALFIEAKDAGRHHGLVITGPAGGALTSSILATALRRVARVADIVAWAELSPHSLRHTCATLALDAGATLRDVQDLLGHIDPRTTRKYDHGGYNLDRSPAYTVAAYLTGNDPGAIP